MRENSSQIADLKIFLVVTARRTAPRMEIESM